MHRKTRTTPLIILILALLPAAAFAQSSPIGRWKTIDDETKKPMTITEVYEAKNGMLAAKVVETLNKPDATCTECSGKQKDKPINGMMVLWDLKKTADGWGDGSGFKPSTGDSFKAKSVKLINDGKTLEITGCKMMFCRTAQWQRVE